MAVEVFVHCFRGIADAGDRDNQAERDQRCNHGVFNDSAAMPVCPESFQPPHPHFRPIRRRSGLQENDTVEYLLPGQAASAGLMAAPSQASGLPALPALPANPCSGKPA